MHTRIASLSLLFAIACGNAAPSKPAPVQSNPPTPAPAPVQAKNEPASTPAPTSAPAASAPSTAPAALFQYKKIPGMLALGAGPKEKPLRYWSPQLENAQAAVIINKEDPLVAEAQKISDWTALSLAGKVPATKPTPAEVKYGCDQQSLLPTLTFQTASPVPEGPVWLLPPGAEAEALPISDELVRIPEKTGKPVNRDIKAGKVVMVYELADPYTVRVSAGADGQKLFEKTFTREEREGAPRTKLSLEKDGIDGYGTPLGAFYFKSIDTTVIVLWDQGFEGNQFPLLVIDAQGAELLEGQGAYYCAF
jgi:hypothetical protein